MKGAVLRSSKKALSCCLILLGYNVIKANLYEEKKKKKEENLFENGKPKFTYFEGV